MERVGDMPIKIEVGVEEILFEVIDKAVMISGSTDDVDVIDRNNQFLVERAIEALDKLYAQEFIEGFSNEEELIKIIKEDFERLNKKHIPYGYSDTAKLLLKLIKDKVKER